MKPARKSPPRDDLWITLDRETFVRLPAPAEARASLKRPGRTTHPLTFATWSALRREGRRRHVSWGFQPTPFGLALIATSGNALCYLGLTMQNRKKLLQDFKRQWKGATLTQDQKGTALWTRRAFTARPKDLPLLLVGTPLQQKVWALLLKIPRGTLARYGDLAAALGRPGAVRAVANAVGANPVCCLLPCHRVCHADGSLRGFAYGEAKKRELLTAEAGH